MAQNRKPVTETATDTAETVQAETRNLATEATSATVERLERATDTASATVRAAADVTAKAEQDLASFWVDIANQQMEHGVAALRDLVRARSLPQVVAIQTDFARESFARYANGASRFAAISSETMMRLMDLGPSAGKRAA